MLLKLTQHMQPHSMHLLMQSQAAWSISQQALSPLVQVMHTPSLVIVHLQMHMAMLNWHIIMPFIMQQQLHMPSLSILHMFCKVAQDISSSQEQVIFIPPVHFSIFMVQQGTMHMLPAPIDIEGIPAPGIDELGIEPIIIGRSNIIVVAM